MSQFPSQVEADSAAKAQKLHDFLAVVEGKARKLDAPNLSIKDTRDTLTDIIQEIEKFEDFNEHAILQEMAVVFKGQIEEINTYVNIMGEDALNVKVLPEGNRQQRRANAKKSRKKKR